MYASTVHWQPVINGNSSHFPATYLQTTSLAVRLPDPRAAAGLAQLGVRFVVLHTELLSPRELVHWQQLPLHSGLVNMAAIDQAIIFRLESTPAREFMNNNW
jgi:hypothetical protein